ncbi:FecR family protein [Reyranella sp.]|uniref:FecR family protein n=1 Tax=Reyranella sp. TaxID=1929291 RepID=UPI003D0C9E4F
MTAYDTTRASDAERDRAGTEAATWLVLLAESPDDRELAAGFEAWRTANPLHAEVWARTEQAHRLAGKLAPQTHDQWPKASTVRRAAASGGPIARPAARPWRGRRLALAGVAMLVAALVLLAAPTFLIHLQADHLTATAETRAVMLDDGTQVRLGPESALAVDFSGTARTVRLIKGEAFFEVVPDSARPFRVAANGVMTTVLGTAFEVRLDTQDVGVAVRRGRVQVDGGEPARSEQLVAGQWVTIGAGGTVRGERNVEEIGDWLEGELVARDRPMTEIVDALRRYYGGRILVGAPTFAATRVTGIYDLRHPRATLTALAASHDATVRQLSPWLLIVTPH